MLLKRNQRGNGITKHYLYPTWVDMMRRCCSKNHPKYKYYGGRGIIVCEAWKDSVTFLTYCDEVLGPRPPGYSLDRIDNSKGYILGNIRWASKSEQMKNRRSYGKGYTYSKQRCKWKVQWNVDGKTTHYGAYDTEEEARKRAKETCPRGPEGYKW